MDDFDRNVFVNCPFDDDYKRLLFALIFTITYLGYRPRLTLEDTDSGKSRIKKILKLVNLSKYGIHDISRMMSSLKGEYYRMNMPFELGIDYGCQQLREVPWNKKKLLVLDTEKYRYQRALSDFSGSDIEAHKDDEQEMVRIIRNWFVSATKTGPTYKKIWFQYAKFKVEIGKIANDVGHKKEDTEDFNKYALELPLPEVMHHMDKWLQKNRVFPNRSGSFRP